MADEEDPRHGEFAKRMNERLAHREEQRKARAENPDVLARQEWEQRGAALKSGIAELLEQPPSDPEQAGEWASKVKGMVGELDALTSQFSYLLTPYDAEAANKLLTKYRETLKQKQSQVAPKKKFAFKAKTKLAEAPKKPAQPAAPAAAVESFSTPLTPERFPGVFDADGQHVANEEHAIARCTGSDVSLCHPMGALRIQGLRDSRVAVGPISGAAYVMDCVGCVRIHDCKDCEFYLCVGSNPIIEDCEAVHFAPYAFDYPGVRGHLEEVGWSEQSAGRWKNVQDFKWLRNTQSPNWDVVEEGKRKRIVVE